MHQKIQFFILLLFSTSLFAYQDLPWLPEGKHGSELEIVRPFLPANPIILEAGAHRGEDTATFIQKWPQATVFAFEPCQSYFLQLNQAIEHLPRVHAFPYGLFAHTGYYTFHVSDHWDGASSLFQDNYPINEYRDYQVEVFCMNLDEWAEEADVDYIDYMWLDMEGAELDMLKSAPKILKTVRAISTEVNFQEFRTGMAQFRDIKEFLEDCGFTLHKIWGSPTWQATAVFIRM